MRPKSLLLLMLALGCGLVASIGINQVLADRRSGGDAPAIETQPIFVALVDIGIGDPILPAQLKLEEWPKGKLPEGAISDLTQLEGRRARTKLFKGDPLNEAKLWGKGEASEIASGQIPDGMRVVAVKVDNEISGRLLNVGDRVDVMVYLQENQNLRIPKSITKTILQNVKVFAVDATFRADTDDNKTTDARTISLLVTPRESQMVMMATQMGEIRIAMRSATDTIEDKSPGVTPDELLHLVQDPGKTEPTPSATQGAGGGLLSFLDGLKTNPTPAATPAPQPTPDTKTPEPDPAPTVKIFKMRIYTGATARDVEFRDGIPVVKQEGNSTYAPPTSSPSTRVEQNSNPRTNTPPTPSPDDTDESNEEEGTPAEPMTAAGGNS